MLVAALALAGALAAVPAAGRTTAAPLSGWLVYGNGAARHGYTADAAGPAAVEAWRRRLNGAILTQALVVRGVPSRRERTVYVGTAAGSVYALAADGRVRWRADLGRVEHTCRQLDEYGVIGTPVVDVRTRALYAADSHGRLHALDLVTGRERRGWPVRLYSDFRREVVWGALALVGRSIYVPTGAYCDLGPMQGKLIRVSLTTRSVKTWTPVPAALGGGGGIWGWAGAAYSARRGSLFVATSKALAGGSNTGAAFREWVGYAEHIVELRRDLRVRAAHHPASINLPRDWGFSGGAVVFAPRGCNELVAAPNKNGRLYLWRTGDVARGTVAFVDLRPLKPRYPLVAQPAYSPRHRSLYLVTGKNAVRIRIDSRCRPRVSWATRVDRWGFNGSPTIAGRTVWFGVTASTRLMGVDAVTGRVVASRALAGVTLAAPTVVDGRLYVGSFAGQMYAFSLGRRTP